MLTFICSRLSGCPYYGLIIALALLMSGCATLTPAPEHYHWPEQQQRLKQLQNWQITGKLGVRTANQGGSLFINWQQQQARYQIHLSGLLGQGAILIEGQPGYVSLQQSGKPEVSADSAAVLLERTLGWQLPVAAASDWVKGVPLTSVASNLSFSGQGQLASLTQKGWIIEYSRYRPVNGLWLPYKLVLQRVNDQPLKLTLIISQWRLTADH
jgi:outer membrane lipoprotein LolB